MLGTDAAADAGRCHCHCRCRSGPTAAAPPRATPSPLDYVARGTSSVRTGPCRFQPTRISQVRGRCARWRPGRFEEATRGLARAERVDPGTRGLRPADCLQVAPAVVEHVPDGAAHLAGRLQLHRIVPVGKHGAPATLDRAVERLAHANRQPLHASRQRAPMTRLNQEMQVPVLHRPVQYLHAKAPLGLRNRLHYGPIEARASQLEPAVGAQSHMHRNMARQRRAPVVHDVPARLRAPGAFTATAVTKRIEAKLRVTRAAAAPSGALLLLRSTLGFGGRLSAGFREARSMQLGFRGHLLLKTADILFVQQQRPASHTPHPRVAPLPPSPSA